MLSGADAKSGSIFCCDCDDFIYNVTVDAIYLSTVVSAEEKQSRFQGSPKMFRVFCPSVDFDSSREETQGDFPLVDP